MSLDHDLTSIAEAIHVILSGEIAQFLALFILMFPFKELRVTTCSFLQLFISNTSDQITYTHVLMHLKPSVIVVILHNVNFPLLIRRSSTAQSNILR